MFSQLVKKMAFRKTRRETLSEQDQIVQYICTQADPEWFQFIVTRPSDMIWDRPSRKKLAASKSVRDVKYSATRGSVLVLAVVLIVLLRVFLLLKQPGPFPITNCDLAEFSLNALRNEKLYNTCPYVVQDGI
jgi:hypothetical protein